MAAPLAAPDIDLDNRALIELESLSLARLTNEEGHLVQATDLVLQFNLEEVQINLSMEQPDGVVQPLVGFLMSDLSVAGTKKTFDLDVGLTLRQVSLHYHHVDGADVTLFSSQLPTECRGAAPDACLLSVRFLDVDPQSPEYRTRHRAVRQTLEIGLASLSVDLQQEALIDIIQQTSLIGARIETKTAAAAAAAAAASSASSASSAAAATASAKAAPKRVASEGNRISIHAIGTDPNGDHPSES